MSRNNLQKSNSKEGKDFRFCHDEENANFVLSENNVKKVEIFDILNIVAKYRIAAALVFSLSTVSAVLAIFTITPIYRVEALLAPISVDDRYALPITSPLSGLATLAGINIRSGGGNIEETLAILKSREFTSSFITDENLIPILCNDIKVTNNNEDKKSLMWKATHKLDSIRFVTLNRKTGLVTLAIEWDDPILASEWVNKMITKINEKMRNEAIHEAESSIEYLKKELVNTDVIEVQQSFYSLIEAQTKTKMLANTRSEYAFRVLDKAVAPDVPVRPRKILIVMVSFTFGFLILFVLIFFHRKFISGRRNLGI